MSWALIELTRIEGETSKLSVIVLGSATKAELGSVSRWAVVVAQSNPPEVVQSAGRAGAVTPSKFSE